MEKNDSEEAGKGGQGGVATNIVRRIQEKGGPWIKTDLKLAHNSIFIMFQQIDN